MNLYWPNRSKFRSAAAKQKRFENKLAAAEAAATEVLNISHGGCLDGAGAVIMTKRARTGVGVAYCQPGDIQRVLEHFAAIPGHGRMLYITDLSMNLKHVDAIISACQRLKKGGWSIEWRDHHHKQWEGIDLPALEAVLDVLEVSPNTESGASLQQKALLPKDAFAKRLAKVHRDRDLWLNKTPEGEILEFAITDLGTDAFVDHMVAKGSKDPVIDDVIQAAADRERARTEAAANKLLGATRLYPTKSGEQVAVVYGWLPKNVGLHEVLENDNVQVAINVRPNGHLSLRSRQGAEVCQLVASQFDGGGHPNASGATLGLKGIGFWTYVLRRGRHPRVTAIARAAVQELERR